MPATVTVAAGSTTASFTATVSSVSTAQTATLTASAGSVAKTFALSLGAEVPTLSVNATTIAFGNVDLNTPSTQSLTLSSTGTAPVTVSAATVTGTGFTVSGATFPLTLNPNQTATLSVEFDPTAAGAASGSLTIDQQLLHRLLHRDHPHRHRGDSVLIQPGQLDLGCAHQLFRSRCRL